VSFDRLAGCDDYFVDWFHHVVETSYAPRLHAVVQATLPVQISH
jgi:hypothetical protein